VITPAPSADDPLWTLAFDHRNSLRRTFFGIDGVPTPDDHARCRAAKAVIFKGALAAIAEGIPVGRPAVLVDEEYGADVITQANQRGIVTVVPVEVSGRAELAFENGDDFGSAIERVSPTYAKVLVRYNPGGDQHSNERQRANLVRLQHWTVEHPRGWMLELLVPPTAAQLAAVHGVTDRYDLEVRPDLTRRAAAELTGAGLRPDLWKLEGMATSAQYAAVAEACGALTPGVSCLVLGRGADETAVDRWLTLAAPVRGFAGFAVGRTLWWEPLRAHVSGAASAEDTAAAIGANFRRLIDVYVGAASGSPITRTPQDCC
jgi:myo-inositol catabolism protein IolC